MQIFKCELLQKKFRLNKKFSPLGKGADHFQTDKIVVRKSYCLDLRF